MYKYFDHYSSFTRRPQCRPTCKKCVVLCNFSKSMKILVYPFWTSKGNCDNT